MESLHSSPVLPHPCHAYSRSTPRSQIESDTGWFLGEPALRFHHVLVRDAAYHRLLKGTRAELHARFADWIEARAPGAVEHDGTLGWHLERAHQHRSELGRPPRPSSRDPPASAGAFS